MQGQSHRRTGGDSSGTNKTVTAPAYKRTQGDSSGANKTVTVPAYKRTQGDSSGTNKTVTAPAYKRTGGDSSGTNKTRKPAVTSGYGEVRMKKGGAVSASRRGDGIATKGKTKGRML